MKNLALVASFALLLVFSCTENTADSATGRKNEPAQMAGLELRLTENPEWNFKNLRLYPICAKAENLEANAALAVLQPLGTGMQTPGFRITERKQFGRSIDNWYNGLTVQNKSPETIFLMAGDVVTGGNQDRVIAHDDVIPPGTVKNIEVFCVEAGRSSYYNPDAPAAEKQLAAFRGYYHVASPQVRQAVYDGNQSAVWSAVAQVTSANEAESGTKAYAALENENARKNERDAYLRFFEGKFSELPNAVGLVAVCNGKVVGVDIFGRPELFRSQYPALLHGYAAEAVAAKATETGSTAAVSAAFQQVAALAEGAENERAGKFAWRGHWVHLYQK